MSIEEARTAQRELEEIAKKYGMGRDVPEGDGWSWEFQPDKHYMQGLTEALAFGLREAARIADNMAVIDGYKFESKIASAIRERAEELEQATKGGI